MSEKKILIVDDDESVRGMIVRVLQKTVYRLFPVQSGEAALAFLERGNEFDLIITDVNMPGGISGIEFLQIVRANEDYRHVASIMMADESMPNILDICVRLNADFLLKPLSSSALLHNVHECLGWKYSEADP